MKKTPQPPRKKKKPAKVAVANPKIKEYTTEEFFSRYLDGEFDEIPPTTFTQKKIFE